MKLTLTYEEAIHCISEYYKGILPVFGNSEEFQIEILENPKKNPNNFSDVLHVSEAILPKSQDNSENISEDSKNPWLIPDENGWFIHDPGWKQEDAPVYIQKGKRITVKLSDGYSAEWSCCTELDWSVEESSYDIIKWKYV